jgi:SWI/SNF-related matrix-associated actin-dependent regulator of chromatin subfamily D
MQPQPHVYPQHPGNMQQPGGMVAQPGMPPAAMQYRKRPSEADTLSKHIK